MQNENEFAPWDTLAPLGWCFGHGEVRLDGEGAGGGREEGGGEGQDVPCYSEGCDAGGRRARAVPNFTEAADSSTPARSSQQACTSPRPVVRQPHLVMHGGRLRCRWLGLRPPGRYLVFDGRRMGFSRVAEAGRAAGRGTRPPSTFRLHIARIRQLCYVKFRRSAREAGSGTDARTDAYARRVPVGSRGRLVTSSSKLCVGIPTYLAC